MLRWDTDANMHMIQHQVAFHNLTFLLFRQLVEYFSKMLSDRSENHLLASLGYKYHVIFAIPLRMTKTLVLSHLILLTFSQVSRIRQTVAHGQTL